MASALQKEIEEAVFHATRPMQLQIQTLINLIESANPEPDVYTVKDVASKLKCSPATVRKLVHHGKIECRRDSKSDKMFFTKEALSDYQSSNKANSSAVGL